MTSAQPAAVPEIGAVPDADLPEWLDKREQALNRRQIVAGIRLILARISRRARREVGVLAALMLLVSLLEAASIGALWPFLALAGGSPGSAARPGVLTGHVLALFGDDRRAAILGAAALVGGLAIATAIARLALTWLTQTVVNRLGHELSTTIYARTLNQPYALFIRRNSSEVLSGIDKAQGLVLGVFMPLLQGANALVMIAVIAAVLLALAPVATLVAAAFMAVIYGAVIVGTRRRLDTVSDVLAETYTARIKSLQEGLGGIRDILIDGTARVFVADFARSDQRFRTASVSSGVISDSPRSIVEGLGTLALAVTAALFALGASGLAGALPLLGVFALSALRILPLAQSIYGARTAMASYSGLLQDVIRLTQLPQRDAGRDTGGSALRFSDAIRFEDVRFRHAGAPADVLAGVDLTVARGTRIGIMGASGSGKSTLLDLAMGLMDPTGGRILVDDMPLGPATRGPWQAGIAHVPQAIFLADMSIAENIAFGYSADTIDEARVHRAAVIADLGEFIASLPQGYATRVGERGAILSGGQRQRVGIARALYRQPQLLVLDEATSALDEATETRVVDAIARNFPGLTMLFVAHRASTLRLCDHIVRLDRGRLVEADRTAARRDAPPRDPDPDDDGRGISAGDVDHDRRSR